MGEEMFYHRKELFRPVNVGTPDAQFGQYLLEQFGGATGELTAALQYWVQSFHAENAAIRDLLQDIAIEEFNQENSLRKIDQDRSLPGPRPSLADSWYRSMFVGHILDHEIRSKPRERTGLSIQDHYAFMKASSLF